MGTKFHTFGFNSHKPVRLNNPFSHMTPQICTEAAEEVKKHIESDRHLKKELAKGKMLGVLVAEDKNGRTGFIAAYSGTLADSAGHEFFVPPVFDAQQPDGYFKVSEKKITAVSTRLCSLLKSHGYMKARQDRDALADKCRRHEAEFKEEMSRAKASRDARRALPGGIPPEEEKAMIRESQFMKAELHRMRQRHRELMEAADNAIREYEQEADALKRQRKSMSENLQRWLFSQYVMLSADGQTLDLCSIFARTPQRVPPAGAGDCCAPKLLQYAYKNRLKPYAMAEFWYGESPDGEVRHHGCYYPACRGKCKPILEFMLQGLRTELTDDIYGNGGEPEIVYEDECLAVVNKPAGMMSVPGTGGGTSLEDIMRQRSHNPSQTKLAHRLDMDTSGLIIVAYDDRTHRNLQQQFARRTVEKRYAALLKGCVRKPEEGTISIPLSPDPLDRPYQKADYTGGKEAITHYRIISTDNGLTRVTLRPETGRTHQLRLHCALRRGLGVPIKGDRLYGRPSDRLYLHAEAITFVHPKTGETLHFESKAGF